MSYEVILLVVLAGMILLLASQNRKRRKDADRMIASLTEGSKVMLHSGIKGTISAIDGDDLVVETTPGVKLTVVKQAVRSVEAATEGN